MNDQAAIERMQLRELRGSILRCLRVAYQRDPDTLMLSTVSRVVLGRERPATGEARLAESLAYLDDMGLIQRIETKLDLLDGQPVILYRLTALGLQILNGERADPGVAL